MISVGFRDCLGLGRGIRREGEWDEAPSVNRVGFSVEWVGELIDF